MPAEVVSIDAVDTKPNALADRREEQFYGAWRDLERLVNTAGLKENHPIIEAAFCAAFKMVDPWKHRARRLESQLRAALASDGLTEERRDGILRALYGRRGTARAVATNVEAQLLEQYRALDVADRAAVRALVERFSTSTGPLKKLQRLPLDRRQHILNLIDSLLEAKP